MTFRDSQGREYSTRITVPKVLALKAAGVDILKIFSGELFQRLAEDIGLIVECLWIVARPETGEVTQEDFLHSLDGDTFGPAVDAMWEGIFDFFPPSKRAALRLLMEKGREVERLQTEKLTAAVDAITPDSILSSIASSSPESSGSSPGDSRSES